jgi:hypothetical protein
MAEHRPTSEQRRRVERRAGGCCEYCRSQSSYSASSFAIEHIDPEQAEGGEGLENLAFACQGCNNHKHTKREAVDPQTGNLAPLFNPRRDRWRDHFAWSADGTLVIGLTPTGRTTVEALHLNREGVVNLRRLLFQVGQHPPPDAIHTGNGAS